MPEAAEYRAVAADGSIVTSIGSSRNEGTAWVQADTRCAAYPKDLTNCGALFRNPSGTLEQRNEYFLIQYYSRFEFSVVD